MTFWFDAHLPPIVAKWLNADFPDNTFLSVWSTGHQTSTDKQLYFSARKAGAVLISKDIDVVYLYEVHGSPPKIIWLTIGNLTKNELYKTLKNAIQKAIPLFEAEGEDFIIISH